MELENILRIRAGRQAFEHIQKNGLSRSDISAVASAAGGPKWFTVYGLTRYLIGEFLLGNEQPIDFIGASVGSWQMSCALTDDPLKAMDRLRNAYAQHLYKGHLNSKEITNACRLFIEEAIGGQLEILLNHDTRNLHVITARGKGLLSSRLKALQVMGFAGSFLGNMLGRRGMDWTAERNVFSTTDKPPFNLERDVLTTVQHSLSKDNIIRVMQASGTIPFMMLPQYDLPNVRKGAYWDGGLTDYHISLPFRKDGIVLLPHFYPFVYAGWFDKKLPWKRYASVENMCNVLLISPSEAYVNSLPQKRISEMADAKRFGEDQEGRVNYWMEISERSLELGEAFKKAVQDGSIHDIVELY